MMMHAKPHKIKVLKIFILNFHQDMLLLQARRSTKHTCMKNSCHMLKTGVICSAVYLPINIISVGLITFEEFVKHINLHSEDKEM